MSELIETRKKIEEIDMEMAALFVKRMACAKEIAAYKRRNNIPILDQGRERELLEKNEKYIDDTLLRPYYRQLMQAVLDISKQYQHELNRDI